MKISINDFRVDEGKKIALKKWPTIVDPFYGEQQPYKKLLKVHIKSLSELQSLLYAANRYSLLIIVQAMDAAGKDGIIKHVMSGINPQGCQVYSFKQPSMQELQHDFLWRTMVALPERGRIGIFNRSYYEEVLIVRVHPEILKAHNLPPETLGKKSLWQGRFRSINEMEAHLHRNGTRILKFFLHLSKEEQGKRFLERIDVPEKNWKFSTADIQERERWDEYEKAYEDCISSTSTAYAPWYIVPADDKANARLIVSKVILETLKGLKMAYPHPDEKRREELLSLRKSLES
jgi:PPK2 family polyphosphate:nucleotide phosphotransferase